METEKTELTMSSLTVKKGNQTYHLHGEGWTRAHFDLLKKEADDTISISVFTPGGAPQTIPISQLDWDDNNDRRGY